MVEATALPLPLESEEPTQDIPDVHNLRTSDIEESDRRTQFAHVGKKDEDTQQPPAESEPSYPPPRSYPLCHSQEQAAWQWNPQNNDGKGGWECAACHPPAMAVQPIPKPKSKSVSWLTLPIAAVL
jgi:hypothetical protein